MCVCVYERFVSLDPAAVQHKGLVLTGGIEEEDLYLTANKTLTSLRQYRLKDKTNAQQTHCKIGRASRRERV